ncbi:hypothetical protein [Sphingobacterium sp. JB170]|uniref:hypothetical protein n=1 Tax=Sphingobacterium sp. JB170 TaxID=1434842 RepID=UPI00097F2EFD|nr:hypothetical protein [Sphingobacterium sp. JB170]SJN48950.1 Flagellar motor rotation protein MotB [Sphingobacterium sp. JB170]
MKRPNYGFLILIGCLFFCINAHSQILRKLGKKLEQKAEKVIDKSIEGVIPENENPTNPSAGGEKSSNNSRQTGPFKNIPLLKNDFVRGSEMIFFDDFTADTPGKMATKWTSNGTGAVQTVEGFDGKWLKLYDANTYKIKPLVRIPENFTIEFDLLTLSSTENKFEVDFGFDYQRGVGSHYYLAYQNPVNVEASYQFNRFSFTSKEVSPNKKSEIEANMSYFVNDVMKVKLKIEGDRMSAYINEFKVLDTEMIDSMTKKYFYLAVNNDKNESEIYISNVRINKI